MINRLLNFLNASPVNFLAVRNLVEELEKAGYRRVNPCELLGKVAAGDKFFVTKNDSSVYAFEIGSKPLADAGFHMICAHCDSPTFRVKPNAEMPCEGGIVKLNTEVYGGPIMSTWFDRPLTLAGRVIVRGKDEYTPQTLLMHVKRPLLQISNLAIHFNRQVNDGVKLSKQKDVLPLLGIVSDELEKGNMLMNVILEELNRQQPGSGKSAVTKVLAIFDNEETGSQTKQGAGSPFLASIINRIALAQGGSPEAFSQAVERAFMVSADNAHALHPNYTEKFDPTNHPVLGGGPVIKFNAAQKYASDAVSAAIFAEICRKAGVPCQRFVNHSDVAGGSTLGNILASSIPLRGVDMGNGILAMHSCRETGSTADHLYCVKAFTQFFS